MSTFIPAKVSSVIICSSLTEDVEEVGEFTLDFFIKVSK